MFEPCTPVLPASLDDTHATWVETKEDFERMLAKLKKAKEIAVDLEHHSYRSYAGFLCLMQISDRDEDWVVDLLAVRDEMEALNEVFTDPEIVKVFHGADSDIVWLQQDFNIYIVNLFDTFQASKLLGKEDDYNSLGANIKHPFRIPSSWPCQSPRNVLRFYSG